MQTLPDIQDILTIATAYNPGADLQVISDAYDIAQTGHANQMRLNGAPFITHLLGTAQLLAEWHLPPNIIAAGLLHDLTEDTKVTLADIEKKFGADIASIVEGETKLDKLKYQGSERYAENLRKMFMAMAKDVRVIFVKFADRIHNLQTLDGLSPEKQIRIARESLEIYAPIANRLGMGFIRGELEDLAFQYVHPAEYAWVSGLVTHGLQAKEASLDIVQQTLNTALKHANIQPISIHGRTKRLYSLYKKLLTHDRDISLIHDLVAQRVIVPTMQDCYATLGVIHQLWRPLKGRIKDYIAQPKPNGYRSIHTTIFCDKGDLIEIQIRTPEIHNEAEYGIAAHWSYKEGSHKHPVNDAHTAWLQELAKIQNKITDQKQFLATLESLKIDFFNNRIFILTPKGDVIDLPEGSTPIDLAYTIHTDLGNSCVGVRINHEQGTLATPLRSGDLVEIIKDKNRKKPSADWLKIAKTKHAKEKIRDHLRRTRLLNWIGGMAKKATFRKEDR